MKQLKLYFLSILCLTACGSKKETTIEKSKTPKTPVEVTEIYSGRINDELILLGTTTYLKRNKVTASIPAFITKVNVKLGNHVTKGEVLYVLQSKESRALGKEVSKIDPRLKGFGIVKVTASASGIISTLDKQQSGDYVLEGAQLCTIAENNDLVFQINVPYEYVSVIQIGSKCMIELPDNTTYSAVFTKVLTGMNVASQTQTFLAKANKKLILPENMIVKASIQKGDTSVKQIVPKSCVLSNEMMDEFWVMKIINDSTAVKTIVKIGNKDNRNCEIISPQFASNDKLILTGNYGLPDTAFIEIRNKN